MQRKKRCKQDAASEAEEQRLEKARQVQQLALKFEPSQYSNDIRCENSS